MPHYLDHAATSPVFPEVIAAYAETAAQGGNPSSLHTPGREARRVVEEAREALAAAIGARPSEVVFTSGGTEADNLAVKGAFWAGADQGRTRLVVSGIEHHAVLDPVEWLAGHERAQVTWVEPDRQGRVTAEALRDAIGDGSDVALVSVMWANNEVGTVQPVADLAAVAHERGLLFHTDAVQALGHLPVDFAASGADLMTITGHKIGGLMGCGALVVRREAELVPLTHGGGQERGIRSGTVDAAGIRAFVTAVEMAVTRRELEVPRVMALRDQLIAGARAAVPRLEVSGAYEPGDAAGRLAGNAHLRLPGCDGDSLLYLLDAAGVACSTGSACQAGVPRPSHVLLAMGLTPEETRGSLRLTLGHTSTAADVEAFLAVLSGAVDRAQRARAASDARSA